MRKYRMTAVLRAILFLMIAGHARADDSSAIPIDDSSFNCLDKMTKVRHFYVDNLLCRLNRSLTSSVNRITAAPIPVTRPMFGALQRSDPRCGVKETSAEDAKTLAELGEVIKAFMKASEAK